MNASHALPAGEAQSLAAFRRLLEAASDEKTAADRPVQMTDRLLGAEAGRLLRRCAVPHEFDPPLLAWLGELDADAAEERYVQFTELAIVQINDDSLSVHERWRKPLWRWWLADAQREQFSAVSERLVEWFTVPADPSGEDPAARRRMFHLIGCRRADGLAAFEQLFRTARHRRRLSECCLLLSLVHEYDPLLSAAELAMLRYHEGKLAGDQHNWEQALPLLQQVAADPAVEHVLQCKAEIRIAHVLRVLGRPDEAAKVLEATLRRAEQAPQAGSLRRRALRELGENQRDQGCAVESVATLTAALKDAELDDSADLAGLLDSLGTAQLKLGDVDHAIGSFEAALARLRRDGDALRAAIVLNNLGLARLEHLDFAAAEEAFVASLAAKREADDKRGQATALLNLVRVQSALKRDDDARRSAEQAAALFQALGDSAGEARAQDYLQRFVLRDRPAMTGHDDKGLPWWAWTLLGLMAILLLLAAVETALE
ncbi:hypothetical protein [Piscinibacter sakaiensis]|uniref:hypothetical protein n=1 Tax=Piscinibacter sakaiensis TaxID=1547922 RepID=UPI003AAA91F8